MTDQTKIFFNFLALVVMGLAFLYRALGINEMTALEALFFIGKTILLTSSFFGTCWLFGKIVETAAKKQ